MSRLRGFIYQEKDPKASWRMNMKHGWLQKKNESGLMGFRSWKDKYLRFLSRAEDDIAEYLGYFKSDEDLKPEETFQLLDIKKCIYLPNKREGCRFDVTTREKTYQFDCVEIQDAKDWVKAINRAIKAKKKAMQTERWADKNQKVVKAGVEWSPLQQWFFGVVFGRKLKEEPDSKLPQVQKTAQQLKLEEMLSASRKVMPGVSSLEVLAKKLAAQGRAFELDDLHVMKRDFPTDAHVLSYMLVHVLAPVIAASTFEEEKDWSEVPSVRSGARSDDIMPTVARMDSGDHLDEKHLDLDSDDENTTGGTGGFFAGSARVSSKSMAATALPPMPGLPGMPPMPGVDVPPTLIAAKSAPPGAGPGFTRGFEEQEEAEDTAFLPPPPGSPPPTDAGDESDSSSSSGSEDEEDDDQHEAIMDYPGTRSRGPSEPPMPDFAPPPVPGISSGAVDFGGQDAADQPPPMPDTAAPAPPGGLSSSALDEWGGAPPPPPAGAPPDVPTSPSDDTNNGVTDKGTRSRKAVSFAAGTNMKERLPTSPSSNASIDNESLLKQSVRQRVAMLENLHKERLELMGKLKPWQPTLGPARLASKGKEVDMRLLDALQDREFVRVVLTTYSSNDVKAHGLAIPTLWLVAPIEFPSYVKIYASKGKCSKEVVKHLKDILLLREMDIIEHLKDELTIGMSERVQHWDTWQALFYAMVGCDFHLRMGTLKDMNSLLISSLHNCRTLELGKDWQMWIYDLLTDITKDGLANDDTSRELYAFVINVLVLVMYQAFFNRPNAHNLLFESLDMLRYFSGHNNESQAVGRTLLETLVRKLLSDRQKFPNSEYNEAMAWRNFKPLMALLRRFVFQSAYWETPTKHRKRTAGALSGSENIKLAREASIGYVRQPELHKIASLEAKMHELDESGKQFVLYKTRKVVQRDGRLSQKPKLTDHGFHYGEDGSPVDVVLAQKTCNLFVTLRLNKVADFSNTPYLEADEKQFLKWAADEYHFWKWAAHLLRLVGRSTIEEDQKLTYRELSVTVKSFLSAKAKERESIVTKLSTRIFEDKPEVSYSSSDPYGPKSPPATAVPAPEEPSVLSFNDSAPLRKYSSHRERRLTLGSTHDSSTFEAPDDDESSFI